jgi:hypothetical protein
MTGSRALAAISAAQLGAGLAGFALAARREHPYDLPFLKGKPEHVVRDQLWMGTALSAPAPMLVAQAVATGALARRADERATATLGVLGLMMVPGYLIEGLTRRNLRAGAWDTAELRVAITGTALAAAMTACAAGSARGRTPRTSPPTSPPP